MNTDDVPTVSVVIPTFNRKDYLAQAIDSVLAQSGAPPLEIVVSDNATDNGTQALMARYASARRLRGNLEHLVLPFAYGVQRGVDRAVLDEYRSNARLDDVVRDTLILVEMNDRDALHECRSFLRKQVPQVLREVEASWNFRWKRLRTLHFTSSLRTECLAGRQTRDNAL